MDGGLRGCDWGKACSHEGRELQEGSEGDHFVSEIGLDNECFGEELRCLERLKLLVMSVWRSKQEAFILHQRKQAEYTAPNALLGASRLFGQDCFMFGHLQRHVLLL